MPANAQLEPAAAKEVHPPSADFARIAGFGTTFPATRTALEDLPAASLSSETSTLRDFGFDSVAQLSPPTESVAQLALDAAREALDASTCDPADLDAIIWVSALAESQLHPSEASDPGFLSSFCYGASWLQEELEADSAQVFGVAQQGCAGMFAAPRMAQGLLAAEPSWKNILCVGADAFPSEAPREILYNLVSDAAAACVLNRSQGDYRWIASHQISRGYYWDTPSCQQEILGAYFPTAKAVVEELLAKAELGPEDIDWFVPSAINASSWPVLLRLLGIPEERLAPSTSELGHTICADNFLSLARLEASGQLRPGQRLLLFTYGFGSSWSAILLEYQPQQVPHDS